MCDFTFKYMYHVYVIYVGDHFLSTRFADDDDYAHFQMENVDEGSLATSTWKTNQFEAKSVKVSASAEKAVRIRVSADSLMLHADDEASFVVSTLHQGDDDYNHFYLVDRGDGTHNIKTKASGRFWSVQAKTSIVYTTTTADDPSSIFTLEKIAPPR